MSISREEVHKAIERLPSERLQEAMDYLRVLLEEPEELTPEKWEKVWGRQFFKKCLPFFLCPIVCQSRQQAV